MTARHIANLILLLWILDALAPGSLAADFAGAISVSPYYTSNAFGLKDDWIDSFAAQQGPGERFAGLSSPWDFVTPLRAEAESRWKQQGGLRFTAVGAVGYEHYLQNRLASFTELRAGGSLETGKNGRSRLRLDWTPRRYKRNYENPDLVFDEYIQAHYGQWGLALDHTQRLRKTWSLQLLLEHENRRYDDPFTNRDRLLWAGGLGVEHDLSKHMSVEFVSKLCTARAPGGIEEGIVVDRSFAQIELSSRFATRLGAWRSALFGALQFRDYTTDNPADASRYGRRDRSWEIGTQWDRRLGTRESLSLRFAHTSQASDRPADLNDPDLVPYHETVLGIGLTRQF